MSKTAVNVLVLGSLGIEQIHTSSRVSPKVTGGTAFYGAEALLKAGGMLPFIVSAIGSDLDIEQVTKAFSGSVDLRGITKYYNLPSFFWQAKYSEGFGSCETLTLENRLYRDFSPNLEALSDVISDISYAYLGGFTPRIQLDCCIHAKNAFVLTETLLYWIQQDRDAVLTAFAHSDAVVVTEHEFAELWQQELVPPCPHEAAKEIVNDLGLDFLIVTFAERGAQVFEKNRSFYVPAVECVPVDVTGAGNVFGGGLVGYLGRFGRYDPCHLLDAAVFGTILASSQVRGFGSEGLRALDTREVLQQQMQLSTLVVRT